LEFEHHRRPARLDGALTGQDVSVVLAVHNGLRYLAETLGAIDHQTVRAREIVLVDDASTEPVADFLAGLSTATPIRYVRLDTVHGIARARNIGNAAAAGTWLAVCDGDDVWVPDKLERQIDFIRSWADDLPLVALGGDALNVNERGRSFGIYPGGLYSVALLRKQLADDRPLMLCHSSVVYRKSAVEASGGYPTEGAAITADTELLTRLTEHGAVLTLPVVLVRYRKHAQSISMRRRQVWEQQIELSRIGDNLRRRRLGQSPVDSAEFRRAYANRPWLERQRTARYAWGRFFYRTGAAQLINGRRLRGGVRLAASALLAPSLIVAGLRRARVEVSSIGSWGK
jgi:glycosyltransferase involved in cell wall biosynthesis